MPPPVNLPSLKSESTRLGLDSGLVTTELSGEWFVVDIIIGYVQLPVFPEMRL